MNHKAESPRGV